MIDLDRVRADLPAVRACAYLNTGTFGPLPEPSRAAMAEHLARQTAEGRIRKAAFDDWQGLMDGSRAALAGVLGASVDEVAITSSTTDGVDLVVGGTDWAAGDEVVTTTHEHPGLTVPLDVAARRHGVVVRTVDPEAGDLAAAIAAVIGPRTRLVALSHVLWTTGDELPLAEIARVAHDAGARVLADGAQGTGCVPVDPRALGVDYYTVSAQKWLCGPSGTGALWVRPEALDGLWPAMPSYLTRDYHGPDGPRDWPGARRLDPGSIPLVAMRGLIASIAWWRGAGGLDGGLDRAAALAQDLRARLASVPGVAVAATRRPTPLVSFRIAGVAADDAYAALERDDVVVRPIPGRDLVRASVGFWTSEGDLDRLVDGVAALAAGL